MHHKNNKRGCHAHDRCCGTRSSRWKCNGFRIDCCLKNVFFEEICFWDILYVTYGMWHTFTLKDSAEAELNDLNSSGVAFFTFSSTMFCASAESTPPLVFAAKVNFATAFVTSSWYGIYTFLFLISHNHWLKAVEFLSVSSFTASSNRFKITISHFNLFNSVIFFNNFFQVSFQLSFSIFVCVGAWIVKILIPIDICFNFSLKIYLVKILSNLISRFLV